MTNIEKTEAIYNIYRIEGIEYNKYPYFERIAIYDKSCLELFSCLSNDICNLYYNNTLATPKEIENMKALLKTGDDVDCKVFLSKEKIKLLSQKDVILFCIGRLKTLRTKIDTTQPITINRLSKILVSDFNNFYLSYFDKNIMLDFIVNAINKEELYDVYFEKVESTLLVCV